MNRRRPCGGCAPGITSRRKLRRQRLDHEGPASAAATTASRYDGYNPTFTSNNKDIMGENTFKYHGSARIFAHHDSCACL